MRTVAIVGVGLIGGSFARALRASGFSGTILGVGSPATTARAMELGVIDRGASLEDACAEADLIYLSHTISRILEVIPRLAAFLRPGALVTDAGSTKVEICAQAARYLPPDAFLGGHPMAGKETRGVDGADATLFANRTYVLTPSDEPELRSGSRPVLVEWLKRIGAKISVMSAADHDQTVALTSHLPQIASTILAATVGREIRSAGQLKVAGSGLTDMTRLALSDYDIWGDILATNREAIAAALEYYIGNLEGLKAALQDNPSTIQSMFDEGTTLATRIRTP